MGLFSFIKEAGEKLFGGSEAKAAEQKVKQAPTPENIAAMSAAAGKAIGDYVRTQGIDTSGLNIAFDAPSATVTVDGVVPDQATKEKILLCCGNVAGVEKVNDLLTVKAPAPEAQPQGAAVCGAVLMTRAARRALARTVATSAVRQWLRPGSRVRAAAGESPGSGPPGPRAPHRG